MEKIAIIVPVYKVEPYIRRCVDSLINQTYRNIQIILVDDGSPDNCGKICEEYANADDRIICIHKENGGLSSARNAGLDWLYENGDAQWISFVDSDDWVHERYVELLYKAVIDFGTLISISGFAFVTDSDYRAEVFDIHIKIGDPEELWVNDVTKVVASCGKLYASSLWKEIRFPNYKLHEDDFTIYKLIFKNKFSILDKPLYVYFQSRDSLTRSVWTPNRLSKFVAKREQMEYFKKNNFEGAYKFTIYDCLLLQSNELCIIRNNLPKHKEYYKLLKKEQKMMIRKYKNEISIPYASLYLKTFKDGIKGMNLFRRIKLCTLYARQFGVISIISKIKNKFMSL